METGGIFKKAIPLRKNCQSTSTATPSCKAGLRAFHQACGVHLTSSS